MRLALASVSILGALAGLATPSRAADLDGPYYRERDVVIERPPPPVVVERERIIERYYEPREEAYIAPRYYAPRVYAPYAYNYAYDDGYRAYRPAYFAARPYWWHRHHRRDW